jgi:hypothetical protein
MRYRVLGSGPERDDAALLEHGEVEVELEGWNI